MNLHGPAGLAVVEVTGPDTRDFLESTLTQRVTDLPAGHWRAALWLDVHGAPLAVMDLVVPEVPADTIHALVPPDLATTVVDGLGGRTFLSQVTLTARDDLDVVAVRGQVPPPFDGVGEGLVQRREGVLTVGRRDGVDLVVASDVVEDLRSRLTAAGLTPVDAEGVRAHAIAAGVPAWGAEIVAPHLPEEVGLLPTHVHLDKGCYPGQEAVARMWMLGRPRRRLARLRVWGDPVASAEAGTGRAKVRITSVAGADALGFVPADAAVGDRHEGEGWGAEVVELVGDDREPVGHQPGVVRRRDRR